MALAVVQHVTAATNVSSTLAPNIATPTQNNLLVACIFTRSDAGPTNPTGFTTAVTVVNSTNADTLRISYKVAGASEADPSWSGLATGGSNGSVADTFEISGADTVSPLDATNSTGETTSVTSISTNTTPTLAQADEICIAVAGLRVTATGGAWNNSYIIQGDLGDGDPSPAYLLTAYRIVSATTAQSSTASWSGSTTAMGAIATFKAAGGGGGGAVKRLNLPLLCLGR